VLAQSAASLPWAKGRAPGAGHAASRDGPAATRRQLQSRGAPRLSSGLLLHPRWPPGAAMTTKSCQFTSVQASHGQGWVAPPAASPLHRRSAQPTPARGPARGGGTAAATRPWRRRVPRRAAAGILLVGARVRRGCGAVGQRAALRGGAQRAARLAAGECLSWSKREGRSLVQVRVASAGGDQTGPRPARRAARAASGRRAGRGAKGWGALRGGGRAARRAAPASVAARAWAGARTGGRRGGAGVDGGGRVIPGVEIWLRGSPHRRQGGGVGVWEGAAHQCGRCGAGRGRARRRARGRGAGSGPRRARPAGRVQVARRAGGAAPGRRARAGGRRRVTISTWDPPDGRGLRVGSCARGGSRRDAAAARRGARVQEAWRPAPGARAAAAVSVAQPRVHGRVQTTGACVHAARAAAPHCCKGRRRRARAGATRAAGAARGAGAARPAKQRIAPLSLPGLRARRAAQCGAAPAPRGAQTASAAQTASD
jgi:hypothetical protein